MQRKNEGLGTNPSPRSSHSGRTLQGPVAAARENRKLLFPMLPTVQACGGWIPASSSADRNGGFQRGNLRYEFEAHRSSVEFGLFNWHVVAHFLPQAANNAQSPDHF